MNPEMQKASVVSYAFTKDGKNEIYDAGVFYRIHIPTFETFERKMQSKFPGFVVIIQHGIEVYKPEEIGDRCKIFGGVYPYNYNPDSNFCSQHSFLF